MRPRQAVILAWLLSAVGLWAQSPSAFTGRWVDEAIAVTLEPAGEGFRVTIEMAGERYPGSAAVHEQRLDGSFEAAGEPFAFQAEIVDEALHFETGGEVFELRRSGGDPTRNPLARARREAAAMDEQSGPRVGDFRFEALEGWTATPAEGGSVALAPADASEESKEFYALSFLPGVKDPEDPSATGVVHQMLGPSAPIARLESEITETEGRRVVRRSFVVDASQYRLDGYFAASGGGLIVVLGRGESQLVESRGDDLELFASRAIYVGRSGDEATARSRPSNGIKTAANVPPFEPGTISDGEPQSQPWVGHLSGKVLTSAVNGNPRTRTLLYPDGRAEIAGAAAVATGWWRIVTANNASYLGLVIQPMSEEVYTRLEMRNGRTFADGMSVTVSAP